MKRPGRPLLIAVLSVAVLAGCASGPKVDAESKSKAAQINAQLGMTYHQQRTIDQTLPDAS